LIPPSSSQDRYPQHDLEGTVTILGDIVEPVLEPEAWEALGDK
jgi:hypothetical protein